MTHSLPTGREMGTGSVDCAHEIRTCSRFPSHERTCVRARDSTRARTMCVYVRKSEDLFSSRPLPNASPTRSRWTAANHFKGHTPMSLYGRLFFETTVKWYGRCLKINEGHFRVRILRLLYAMRRNLVWSCDTHTCSPQSRR